MKYSKETKELMMELENLKATVKEFQDADTHFYETIVEAKNMIQREFLNIGFQINELRDVDLNASYDDIFISVNYDNVYCTLWGDTTITVTDINTNQELIKTNITEYTTYEDIIPKVKKYIDSL